MFIQINTNVHLLLAVWSVAAANQIEQNGLEIYSISHFAMKHCTFLQLEPFIYAESADLFHSSTINIFIIANGHQFNSVSSPISIPIKF